MPEKLEMGYTLDEFATVLQGNFTNQGSVYRCKLVKPDVWIITEQSKTLQMEIFAKVLPVRQLGLLQLPRLMVSFKMQQGSNNDANRFFEKFFKYFHKGGG